MRQILKTVSLVSMCSCAQLHHVQVGDIDNSHGSGMARFELKVSETGVNFEEAGKLADSFRRSKSSEGPGEKVSGYLGLIQMGPKTGEPVFSDNYAADLVQDIYKECPSGRVTGLMSIRESRKYPVISGEIVKVTGYCLTGQKSEDDREIKEVKKSKKKAEAESNKDQVTY